MTYFKGYIKTPFQSPKEGYDEQKGNAGVDYEMLEGTHVQIPVDSVVMAIWDNAEKGKVLCLKDQQERIHVLAGLSEVLVQKDHVVEPHQFVGKAGSLGMIHYEIISTKPQVGNEHMTRTLGEFSGYSIDPEAFLNGQHWSYDAMTWMLNQDLIGKMHDPKETLAWGEFAVIMRRLGEGMNGVDDPNQSTNPS